MLTSCSGAGYGQRAQQHGIDHAEYCGVRSDAQRQRERGGSSKARSLAQRACAVPHVLEKCFDHVDLRMLLGRTWLNESPHIVLRYRGSRDNREKLKRRDRRGTETTWVLALVQGDRAAGLRPA